MKIVIVGGGTAGWITAALFLNQNLIQKNNPNLYDIVVVESKDIPIIGAGEGSTGMLADLISYRLNNLGIDDFDFLRKTDSTLKLGIRFKDWNKLGTEYLSPIQPTITSLGNIDIEILAFKMFGKYHEARLGGYLMERGLSTYNKFSGKLLPNHSYHFDAFKVGQYFKNKILDKIKLFEGNVTSINKKDDGSIKNIILNTSETVEGDYFIDCTGFARILAKEMESGWISFKKYLPVDSAIPYLHQYSENEKINPETLAWAQPNGWMWQIPTQERYGCGYVYSSQFTNAENALDELHKNTKRKIEPIKNISFESGRLEKFWNKNVISIGLSSGFLEPLQATSIHSTIVQIDLLINELNPYNFFVNDIISEKYNRQISYIFDDFRDLIQSSYLSKREDTPFWKFCKYELEKTDTSKQIMEICKYRCPSVLDFKTYHGCANWGVYGWTIMGMELLSNQICEQTLSKFNLLEVAKDKFETITKTNKSSSLMLSTHTEFVNLLRNKKI